MLAAADSTVPEVQRHDSEEKSEGVVRLVEYKSMAVYSPHVAMESDD